MEKILRIKSIGMHVMHQIVCLSHSRIFQSYGDVTMTGEWLQALTYARHSWSLSSEGSLAWPTYCDTGHPLMVISKDPWHSHLLPSVWQWSCHYLFLRRMSVAAGIWTPNLPLAGRTQMISPQRWRSGLGQPTAPPLRRHQTNNHYKKAVES